MLPDEDGFSLCRWIRSHQRLACMPIIMLTASSDEADRVIGLELGADDYLGKPFSPRELLARIKALLRRAQFTQVGESYTAGNLLGSIGYRGLSLATDDRMLPESLRRYAPQVRGTAATAARVVISQNGRKIREVNVAPGPFVIDDLYDSAYVN